MIDEKRFSQYEKTFQDLQTQISVGNNKFRTQKIGEKVKLLAGVDGGKFAASIICSQCEIDVASTSLISVKKIYTFENETAVVFSLTDDSLLSIFITFCIDLENVISFDNKVSIIEIYNRYLYWQKMFKPETKNISESTVKGLIGELRLIEEHMIPKYGNTEAINGWMGSEKAHKDFAFKDGMWYEAKAVNTGKLTVKISSIEQLYSENIGILVIAEIEKTSSDNPQGFRLFDLLNIIKDKIDLDDVQMTFYNKVLSIGITLDVFTNPNHEANSYRYIFIKTNCFKVDASFPKLEKHNLSNAIGLVSYELIISEIENYKTDFF